jgi:hypothetical protein
MALSMLSIILSVGSAAITTMVVASPRPGSMDMPSSNASTKSTSSMGSAMPELWQASGDVNFVEREGFPHGLIEMKATKSKEVPSIQRKNLAFENGTIEFDVKPIDDQWPTVNFRVHDSQSAEEFYIRPNPDCAVSIDCIQYAPKIRGRMLWDSNYEYQRAAPFRDASWNHVKLVISGRRMNVYINHTAQPVLAVDELEGIGGAGNVELEGPGLFTNIVISPGKTEGLSPMAVPDPTASDHGYVRHWKMTLPLPLTAHVQPTMGDVPDAKAIWTSISAERLGLINLARHTDRIDTHIAPHYTWLKADVHSELDQIKRVSIGYLRVVTVFVNGKSVYSGKNLYNTLGARQAPDGRLGLENGRFDLPLKKGENEVVVALQSNDLDMSDRYGYGFRFHIDDATGLIHNN